MYNKNAKEALFIFCIHLERERKILNNGWGFLGQKFSWSCSSLLHFFYGGYDHAMKIGYFAVLSYSLILFLFEIRKVIESCDENNLTVVVIFKSPELLR